MDSTQFYARELGDFLRSRRGRLRPQDVGLIPGPRRRVDGLRREELALLAGVSTDYYQRLEQGRDVRPSDDVLDGLARALDLTGEERRHLHALAAATRRPPARRRRTAERVPASVQRLIPLMGAPTVVVGRHLDVLAWNGLAADLLPGLESAQAADRNMLIALFRDPDAFARCPGWETTALEYIGMLRAAVAADPEHPRALGLVGELSIRSETFRKMWARHDVRETAHGRKTFTHPQVGELILDWDAYPLPGAPGPVLVVYTAEPGSVDAERLQLVAGLRAAREAEAAGGTGRAAAAGARGQAARLGASEVIGR